MADALCREYHLGVLPTELLQVDLAPGTAVLVNARILAWRNEQAKLASNNESLNNASAPKPPGPTGRKSSGSVGDRIRAKRMNMQAQRTQAIRHYGL